MWTQLLLRAIAIQSPAATPPTSAKIFPRSRSHRTQLGLYPLAAREHQPVGANWCRDTKVYPSGSDRCQQRVPALPLCSFSSP
ncbi:hypothetical protein PC116_g7789 [Phytophthora cactorum]|uniref:Uncharacterized protein n=1 Tax=Phytophthora cactorum TaxID=29920 RepID=A0A8T1EKT1_9STRA|nr:hypothetical protein PC114_g2957 [Phytophthora cactorum]KAG2952172.1 hypothetical protein PC117_g3050 [Phytophthora cactorum]KAG3012287.1 hypothetical protein PC119_g12904 [Phytophthora cactorum]KAG3018137.1 hypothetical protein PC120_g10601 [Phytophthora cactorum]KAG3165127.1 hypothetical protein C6341_g12477 [Phytophthora cactorum]